MPLRDALLAEYDQEVANTRKTLERVPEGKFDWRPHPKSGTLIWLASHVANLTGWAKETLTQSELDLAPGGKQPEMPPPPKTTKELLAFLDKNVAGGRAALAAVTDEQMFQPWSLKRNGQVLMTLPRAAVLRSFVLNHLIHHRAQLTVYLRLLDVPVPALYGPSADERPF